MYSFHTHILYTDDDSRRIPPTQKIFLCIQSFKHVIEPLGTKILYICYIVFKVVRFVGSNLFNRSSEYQYLGKVCIMQDKICIICSEM
jgi:fucose permease